MTQNVMKFVIIKNSISMVVIAKKFVIKKISEIDFVIKNATIKKIILMMVIVNANQNIWEMDFVMKDAIMKKINEIMETVLS